MSTFTDDSGRGERCEVLGENRLSHCMWPTIVHSGAPVVSIEGCTHCVCLGPAALGTMQISIARQLQILMYIVQQVREWPAS